MDTLPLPSWLDSCRWDDALSAQAYETTSPPLRACLKNGVALLYALWGEAPARSASAHVDPVCGFCVQHERRPVPWAVCCFTPTYNAPARLVAALMPALLARVPLTLAVCVGGSPHPSACLALELLGIEHSYSLNAAQAHEILIHLATGTRTKTDAGGPAEQPSTKTRTGTHGEGQTGNTDRNMTMQSAHTSADAAPLQGAHTGMTHNADALHCGRLTLLHTGELAPLGGTARQYGIPVWEESAPPRVLLDADCPVDTSLLAYAQPDALIYTKPCNGAAAAQTASGHVTAAFSAAAATPAASPHTAIPFAASATPAASPAATAASVSKSAHAAHSAQSVPSMASPVTARFSRQHAGTFWPFAQGAHAALTLGAGMEGCWVHPTLTPDFFRQMALHIALCPPCEDDDA